MTSAASSRAKQQQASKPAVVSQPVATATQWQGPLPPPDALEKFNTIVERGAERVFRMTEIEQRHRIESERAALDSNILAFKAENMARGLRMKAQGDAKGLVVQTLVRASWLILLAITTLQAQAKSASEIFEQTSPSVVVVYGYDVKGKKQSQGSGVVLPGGDVATNCHVLKGTPDYSVNYRDKTYTHGANRPSRRASARKSNV